MLRAFLQRVDAGYAHTLETGALSYEELVLGEKCVILGLLRRLPASGRWADRYAVTSRFRSKTTSFVKNDTPPCCLSHRCHSRNDLAPDVHYP